MPYQKIYQQRIILVATAVLILATLLVGIGIFLVMQRHTEALLSKNLQSSLRNRVQQTQAEIDASFDKTMLVTTRLLLLEQVQQANAGASTAIQSLNKSARTLLETGLTAIALFDQNGREVAHAGTFAGQAAFSAHLDLPGSVQLIWNGQLLLHSAVNLQQAGHVIGRIVIETPLPITTGALKNNHRLNNTEKLALCAPLGLKMQCLPSTLNPGIEKPFQRSLNGDLLPMAHALAGETGFITTRDYRHREVVAAYAPIGNLGLGMVLKIDSSELYASVWDQLRYLLPLLIVVLAIVLLLLHWLLTPLVARLVRSEAKAERRSTALSQEIAEHKHAQSEIFRFKNVLDNTLDMIFMFEPDSLRFVYLNRGAILSTGYSREELLDMTPCQIKPLFSEAKFRQILAPLIAGERALLNFETIHQRKDGTDFPVDVVLQLISEGDKKDLFVAIVRDITERKQFEARLLHQATHDALTGLPNRALFHDILLQATAHALRTEKLLAVLFLDLDKFKYINDTLGHEYGDMLLKEIAQRLTATLRKDDLVARGDELIARQGGDEFTILLQGVTIVQNISQVANKILAAIAEPFSINGHEMHVTASIGITVFPFDDTDIEHLLQNADIAMFRAKESGKNNFQFYTAAMNTFIQERMEIENGLRHALEKNELVLLYQPQVDLESGQIIAVEALLRWAHPEKGLILPDRFIPVAEESGLIVPIGEWVLRTACQQNRAWQDAGLPHIRMAVNLSARQFREPHLVALVAKTMADANLDPQLNNLELEVTESMIMQDMESTVATLNSLHEMGVHLSIDDFGMGYSNLSHLKRFPINTLKIDQSFVKDITIDPNDAAITAIIVSLGHSLKLRVIAEGVETAEQLAFLRAAKCDEIQGYYFSRPLPADELAQLLREGRRLS